jgi:hypothetical protein
MTLPINPMKNEEGGVDAAATAGDDAINVAFS